MSAERWVATRAIQEAVKRRESDVLQALGIPWDDGAGHITCPYPDHADDNPSWRWDERKARAHCTCIDRSHSIFDVVMRYRGHRLRGGQAARRGSPRPARSDQSQRRRTSPSDGRREPAAATGDQRDDDLPRAYLAIGSTSRRTSVPMPSTPVAGWRALAYYDPPQKKGGKPKLVGHYPVRRVRNRWRPTAAATRTGSTSPRPAQGKAELGTRSDGRPRDPKKSARLKEGQSAAGCAVLWGDPAIAPHLIASEGIETAAAVALAHRQEIEAESWRSRLLCPPAGSGHSSPGRATRRITVAADRDEGGPDDDRGHRAGERAARESRSRAS